MRLHVSPDGVVWLGCDGTPYRNTGLTPWAFAESDEHGETLDNAREVRLLGTRDNAPLIVKLHERWIHAPGRVKPPVMLGSPTVVPALGRASPAEVLHQLYQPRVPSMLAGMWHPLTTHDYSSYALIDSLHGRPYGGEVPGVTRKIAARHPAWPAVSFVDKADADAACWLLSDVTDPRWFRHPLRPDRPSRLHAFLGLCPVNIRYIVGQGPPDRHAERAENVLNVWGAGGGFVRRLAASYPDERRGLLAGSKMLVAFVAGVWLDAVRPPSSAYTFRADAFFPQKADAVAFEKHRTNRV